MLTHPTPAVTPQSVIVFGAGRRGTAHARAALDSGLRVAAVCDPDTERAARLAAEVGGVPVPTIPAALEYPAEVTLITTPPPLHAAQTLAALHAGRHVILEKPIALNMEEARQIQQAAEATGRQVFVCQQHRYSEAAEHARQALAGRRIALAHIWLYRQAPDIPGNWRREWGGGHVVEWAIHPIDFCRYVMGDVEAVYAAYADQVLAGTPNWDNWDAYTCSLRFRCGAVGSVATTYACWPGGGGGFGLDIAADGVVVRWRGSHLEVARPDGTTTYPEPVEPTVCFHRAVYQYLRSGNPAHLRQDFPDAIATLATVLACNRSHATELPVRVADVLGG